MELPRLRLRKVFEHGTHFKVQKPGGQSITIAKKGLSPGTVKRYQKLAHGGEVRNYQVGGEVTATGETVDQLEQRLAAEQAELDRAAQQDVAPVAAPATEAAPAVMPRRVIGSTSTAQPQTMRQEVAALPPPPEQPSRLEARREALEAKELSGELPGAAPAPAAPPPVVIINNTPAPATEPQAAAPRALTAASMPAAQPPPAPVPAPVPATSAAAGPRIIEEPPAPPPTAQGASVPVNVLAESVQPVAPVRFDDVATVPGFQPLAAGAPAFTARAKGFAAPSSLPGLAAPLNIQRQPMAMPPPSIVAPAAVAPFAPIAATATTPFAAPLQIAPLTAEKVSAAVKADPNASLGDVVRKLVGPSMAQLVDVAAPEFSTIKASDVAGKDGLINLLVGGFNNQINAAVAAGDAEAAESQAQIASIEAEEIRLADKAKRDKERFEVLQTRAQTTLKDAEASDDLKSFFDSQGAAYGIFSVVALAIGGALSGYTKTPNYVMQAFNNAMAADLEEQKRRRNSRWQKYKEATGDAEAASDLVIADDALLASVAMKKQSAKAGLQKIQPQVDAIVGKLQAQAAEALARVDLRLAQADDEREVAQPRVARPSAKGGAAELAREKFETGRTVGVGGIPVQTSTTTGAAQTNRNLANRNFSVLSLTKALDLLEKTTPAQFADLTGGKRAEAIATLAYVVENFPQAFGYERAVSQSAAKQLKIGLQNPTEARGVFTALISRTGDGGRRPSTGLKILRDEAVESRRQFVKQLAMPGSLRDQEAAEYGLWKLESEDARAAGKPTPKVPRLTLSVGELQQTPYQRQQAGSVSIATTAASPPPAAGDVRAKMKRVSGP